MWIYEKKLQYPVKIKNPNPKLAAAIISQLGGPDGEAGAAMRYLHQRYSMPYNEVVGILTDVGTEEIGHMEMISAIIYQLTRNISIDQIKGTAFEPYYVDHTTGIYPIAASGVPFDMKYVGVKGDPLADLAESQAAEQKARVTYDNLIRLSATFSPVCGIFTPPYFNNASTLHYYNYNHSSHTKRPSCPHTHMPLLSPRFSNLL